MAGSVPATHATIIDQFHFQLKQCEILAACGRKFFLIEQLKSWLTHGARLPSLLEEVYSSRDRPAWPIQPSEITDINNSFLLTFSILLKIGRGNFIHEFHRRDFGDWKLPIILPELEDLLRQLERERIGNAKAIIDQFDEHQWSFCPPKFEFRRERRLLSRQILPILNKKQINQKGGTADIWLIEVPEQFVGATLREAAANARYTVSNEKDVVIIDVAYSCGKIFGN